ncbi:MAG: Fic family protein [Patescibacteria group bacterium]|nr:Fic family protein [Patescibacteria group bacterium]MBU1160724.1 Fic family protein [Patescibacteria group bacterium]MBU1987656.1 Fic family protein [Patescibacteria group bacterium]
MIKIEKKIIKNKPFFYLTEQINIGPSYKKIQVYIGKNIPKNLSNFYEILQQKEIKIIIQNIKNIYLLDPAITLNEYKKIETARIKFKYWLLEMSEYKKMRFWKNFAIKFIFESNAIEGSKLSQNEVEKIIKKQYIKKKAERQEILEVENSIKAFEIIKSAEFKLNQRSIIELHKILVNGLSIDSGYKTKNIIVNNKTTISPGEVRKNMAELLLCRVKQKNKKCHPFITAVKFHQRFELIHPFSDGNGRIGRLLLNWMLLKSGYGIILLKNKNRQAYFSSLDQADNGRPRKLFRHCVQSYQRTFEDFLFP